MCDKNDCKIGRFGHPVWLCHLCIFYDNSVLSCHKDNLYSPLEMK